MCEMCDGSGYILLDIGTATIPDYIEVPCRCNRPATDADAPEWADDPEPLDTEFSNLYAA